MIASLPVQVRVQMMHKGLPPPLSELEMEHLRNRGGRSRAGRDDNT